MNTTDIDGSQGGHSHWERAGVDADEAVELLRAVVDTPSPTGHEATLAEYLARWCRERGLRARLQPLGAGRANVIAKLEGQGVGPSLLLDGHMDTSYTGEETYLSGIGYKPRAVVRDGWLFGLGSVNMKSGLAAALMTIRTLDRRGDRLPGEIMVAGVAGEIEKACVDGFQGPDYTGYGYGTRRLLAHGVCPDYAVVCEPTDFMPSHGQLGALWIRVSVDGDMRHTAFFDGRSSDHAIYDACKVVEAIREWGLAYQDRHAYEGQPACVHVGAIDGGWPWRISRTPFDCTLYVDIRINPEQRPEAVLREFKEVVRSALPNGGAGRRIDVDPYVIVPSVVARGDEPVFKAVHAAHESVFGQPAQSLFRGPMADSGHLNAAGIVTATYGLGPSGNFDVANPETGECGEQIRVDDYLKLIGIYIETATQLCHMEEAK